MTARWAALVVVLHLLSAAPSEAAQTGPSSDARLVVTAIEGIVGPGTARPDTDPRPPELQLRVLVENRSPAALDELRVSVEVFSRARFRSTLAAALDGEGRVGLRDSTLLEVRAGEPLRAGDIAGVSINRPVAEMPWSADPATTGVYPVSLTLLHGTEELDRVDTAIVYLAEPVAEPLVTTVVWPLDAAPWRQPGGGYPARVDTEFQPGGRLDGLLRAVERDPGGGVLLAPAAHLLEDLADRADGFTQITAEGGLVEVPPEAPAATLAADVLERLRAVAAALAFDPIAGAYADADVAGLADAAPRLDAETTAVVTQGRRRLDQQIERRPDPATFLVTTPIDRDVLDVLVDSGIEHLLLPADQVEFGQDLADFPELPGAVRGLTTPQGRRITATVPDPHLDAVVRGHEARHGPLVVAQRILAETAVLWTERPNASGRPLGIQPPRDWDVSGPVAAAIHDAVTSAPWLGLTDPAGQRTSAEDPAVPGTLTTIGAALPDPLVEGLVAVRAELADLVASTPGQVGESIAGRPLASLERQLLRAPSSWTIPTGRGLALVNDVRDAIRDAYGDIDVPTGARITLTSESGTIPVTIQRRSGDPLRVRVHLESRASLRWTDGQVEEVTFDEPGVRTLSFPVRVAAPGSFGVNVTVTDVRGDRILATGTIPVRSTALSGPALIGTGGVVLILLLIGLRRRSRPTKRRLEVVTSNDG